MSSKAKRRVVLGLETTPGDGAVPDISLRATAELKPKVEKIVPDENIGSFAPARHFIASQFGEGKLTMEDAYYEHAPYPISMAMGPGVKTGVSDPYTYTFTLPDTATPTFATYRMEISDGNNHIVRCDDVLATALTISGEAGKSVKIEADLSAGSVSYPAALGATPSVNSVTPVLMAVTQCFIDDSYTNIGTTQMTQLISFSWKLENYQHHKMFAGALYPTGRGNDKWKVILELVVEIDNAKIESEKDKLLATTQSAVRIKATASASDSLTIDGAYFVREVDNLDDRDGNNIVKITYEGQKDANNNTPSIVVVTNLSGL